MNITIKIKCSKCGGKGFIYGTWCGLPTQYKYDCNKCGGFRYFEGELDID